MTREKITISLPAPLRRYIEGRAKFQYGSVSEYIRELVREDQARMLAAEEAALAQRSRYAPEHYSNAGARGRY